MRQIIPAGFFRLESFLKGQKLYGFVDGTLPCPPQFVLDSAGNIVAITNVASYQSPSPQPNTVTSSVSSSPVSIPVSAQTQYVPIPAMPYGFGPNNFEAMAGFYAGRDRGQSSNANSGSRGTFYGHPGSHTHTGGYNAGNGGNNTGYSRNGGNLSTCQLCGKVGHVAKTCRTLSNFSSQKGSVECQFCGRPYHTADRCFEIIGFPNQQNQTNGQGHGGFQSNSGGYQSNSGGYQVPLPQHHMQSAGYPKPYQQNHVGSAMMASSSNSPLTQHHMQSAGYPGPSQQTHVGSGMMASSSNSPQFWLADSGASNHMTSEVQLLQNLAPYSTGDTVQIGQGNGQSAVQRTE